MTGGCIKCTQRQWWSSLFWIGQLVWEKVGSLSKTTKLLLLDSLLQEVCIESGSDGSLALSSLGLSVCLVSHNLLYSGLKKAHLKMKTKSRDKVHFIVIPWIIALILCWWSKASWEQKLHNKEHPFSQAHNKSSCWFLKARCIQPWEKKEKAKRLCYHALGHATGAMQGNVSLQHLPETFPQTFPCNFDRW